MPDHLLKAAKTDYFLDTYALFELAEGNPNFTALMSDVGLATTKLNLMELYYGLLRIHGEDMAESCFIAFSKLCIPVPDSCLKKACAFRLAQKKDLKKNFSYIDCIGYVLAEALGVSFLTGDSEFKGIANVLFVK